jgi:hypothetical protein
MDRDGSWLFPIADLVLLSMENIFEGTAYIMYATIRKKIIGCLNRYQV